MTASRLYQRNGTKNQILKGGITMNELESKIREYREMKRLAEEAQAAADAIAEELKAHMTEAGTDKMTVGEYKVSYTVYASSRIDTTALKKDMPDVAQLYTKVTETRRFQVA
jgi:predicted phage-related endonuclease